LWVDFSGGVCAERCEPMLTAVFLASKFAAGIPYNQYVSAGTADQKVNWDRALERVHLSAEQAQLVKGFTRRINVLVSSGLWCGDCAHQCPMLARIADANPGGTIGGGIDLRFLDRDAQPDLRDAIKICAGTRVPTVIFMAEDHEFISILGDKTLARLRAKAAKALGEFCPLPGAELPEDELAATLGDWLNEFERVHLMLRLSTRLRAKHGD